MYEERKRKLDRIIWCVDQILFRAEIAFRRLHGRMPEEQLNPLKLTAGCPTQLGAGTSQVVGSDTRSTGCRRMLLKHLPNDPFA